MRSRDDLLDRQRCLNGDAPPLTVLHMARKDTGKRGRFPRAVVCAAVATVVAVSLLAVCGHHANSRAGAVKTPAENENQADVEKTAYMKPLEVSVEPDIYRPEIPLTYDEQLSLYNAAQEFGVDYFLMIALIHRETNFRNIPGDGGESIGYAQIQPKWWSELMEEIGAVDLTVPEDNFRTACAILASLAERYGNIEDALTAYNRGTPGFSQYAKTILVNAENWREAANE